MVVLLPHVRSYVGGVLYVLGGRVYDNGAADLQGLPVVDALDDEGERLLADLHETMAKAKYASNKGPICRG